ncbi:hypothetical protein EYZ11_005696 [Aspergillus tanneri]|uniref:Alb1-domain-containing protein n=1 Tax=Aspergillus tanneri TaxID=1220188 RepID=A0A4V3UPE2_9EURO|nr:uncharacterized protein ATNIH1004_001628 [Aspergillus tanneri]KAA8652723.1 hypothetical protein ATNIH1004_001628 [Aspergillus tanneri]THC94824.1 hypothetical protein EYZ11_005696 [Aspergillus tanneri]
MAKARSTQSKHSRAARRAASPSLDVDKSLTSLPRAQETALQRDSILSDRVNSGVTKKQSKPKTKSRSQLRKQQKGIERAEIVLDQLEKKVSRSVGRAKTVKARRAEWEDLNRKSSVSKFQALDDTEGNDGDDAMIDDSRAPAKAKPKQRQEIVVQNPVVDEPKGIDVDDDIT